jgi:tRNA threonylcarbamoyladenosine biosynthesis protein TsaE
MSKILINDISHIDEAAATFLKMAEGSSVFAFYGSMGAGKTTFITALCRVLGVEDVVNSPTFTIVNEYCTDSGRAVYHFDFYRINKIQEAIDIGFDEYVYDSGGICFMEWPEKIEELLPEETLKVFISVKEDGSRQIDF